MPLPVPSFKRLIPAVYAYWNAVKGGSDTTTKLMDDCLPQLPFTNCETVASTRCIFILFVLCHRLFQLFSAKENLEYSCLENYRKASSKRYTFHHTLLRCSSIFQGQIKSIEEEMQCDKENQITSDDALQTSPKRVRPIRRVIDGAPLQQVTFAPSLPTVTPKKITKKVRDGSASSDVIEMVNKCHGIPLKIYKAGSQQRCEICDSKTTWYCAMCKRFLCVEKKMTDKLIEANIEAKQRNKPPLFEIYNHKVKGKDLQFLKVCYHNTHESRWCTMATTPFNET